MRKFRTREVLVGAVGVGAHNPVRIQSMTTSDTADVEATIAQVMHLADSGCEIVRVTVQGMKEAKACEHIKNGLIARGYNTPLVADIHFYPPAALHVIDFVDKVRVNPGNFVDRRATFKVIEYDDAAYAEELERIEEKFSPLVEKCKRLKKAMRIGTNHGSLSDRIMNRFGDTPRGMVESAIEFASVCRKLDYHNFVFSMKASNPVVMIEAYRTLVAEMESLGWDYPLHLGVTEAGLGEDGRIKSAMGIGALLLDGIGDTIRVSLTEDPWHEIAPCKQLITFAQDYTPSAEPARRSARPVAFPSSFAMHKDGTVCLPVSSDVFSPDDIGVENGKIGIATADCLLLDPAQQQTPALQELAHLGVGLAGPLWGAPVYTAQAARQATRFSPALAVKPWILQVTDSNWQGMEQLKPAFVLLSFAAERIQQTRCFVSWLEEHHLAWPVLLNFAYTGSAEEVAIQAGAEVGSLLADKMAQGLALQTSLPLAAARKLSFNILQAARMRSVKTDFISCPSCGRTLFDLQEVTRRIQARTAHLPGVKIAIMGCIVNGPGEMADADFGYVGSKPGMIELYVGKTCVEKDIPFAEADEKLVALIKAHGRWLEPQAELAGLQCQ